VQTATLNEFTAQYSGDIISRFKAAAEAAKAQQRDRAASIREARALIRKAGIRHPQELISLMQCLHSAIKGMDCGVDRYAAKLLVLCCEMDDEFNAPGEEA